MKPLETLFALVGTWHGPSRLWLSPTDPPGECESNAVVSLLGDGLFVRMDYTWTYEAKPQEGSLLIGCDSNRSLVTTVWMDTWHNGERVMMCQGEIGKEGNLVVRGSYPAPTGPDWGWWIRIEEISAKTFTLRMDNVSPDGKKDLAVESSYAHP